MRICFVIPSLAHGGAERQVVILSDHLAQRGHECVILTLRAGGPLAAEALHRGVPVLNKRTGVRQLSRRKPDVLYPFLTMPCVVSTLALRPALGRPRLVWGIRHSNLEFDNHRWYAEYGVRLAARLAPMADAFVSNSESGAEWHEGLGYPESKMHVIPNGFETDVFRRDESARNRVRAEWRVAPDENLVGCVGRPHPMKDRATFLRAAAIAATARPDARFVVVGEADGAERRGLQQLADHCGLRTLVIAGPRDDMPAVYSALDVLCMSSRASEGFPNVVGEAMACEVPCVVTDVGDAARIVGDEGVAVPPSDPEALAGGMQKLLDVLGRDPQVGARARQQIIDNYAAALAADRTEQLCESLL